MASQEDLLTQKDKNAHLNTYLRQRKRNKGLMEDDIERLSPLAAAASKLLKGRITPHTNLGRERAPPHGDSEAAARADRRPMGTMIQKHELEEADTGKKALSTLRMSEMAAHLVVQVGFQWHLVPQLSHLVVDSPQSMGWNVGVKVRPKEVLLQSPRDCPLLS